MQYVSLLDRLKQEGRGDLLGLFEDRLTDSGRAEALRAMFLGETKLSRDEQALTLLSYYSHALRDKVFAGINLNDEKEFRRKEDEASALVATHLVEDWQFLPVCEPVWRGSKDKKATLPKTKTEFVRTIAARWARTDDETEANMLFNFLLSIRAFDQEEAKLLLNAFREGDNTCAPLLRHLSVLGKTEPKESYAFSNVPLNLHTSLIKGLASDSHKALFLRRAALACGPVVPFHARFAASDDWDRELGVTFWPWLEQGAKRAVALTQKAIELGKLLRPKRTFLTSAEEATCVQGEIDFVLYEDLRGFTVMLTSKDMFYGNEVARMKFAFGELAKAVQIARTWRTQENIRTATWPRINIQVLMWQEYETRGVQKGTPRVIVEEEVK